MGWVMEKNTSPKDKLKVNLVHSHFLHPMLPSHSLKEMGAYLLLGTRGMGSSWHLTKGLVGSTDARMGLDFVSGCWC